LRERFKNKYRIESTRLQGHDYGNNGAYFVTICTADKFEFLGKIIVVREKTHERVAQKIQPKHFPQILEDVQFRPNPIGEVAINFWKEIPTHYPFVKLDEFQFMPNHLHGIIIISKPTIPNIQNYHYKNKFGPQSGNLSAILRGYKAR
jgi:REP element-mobilizing transposase RayT